MIIESKFKPAWWLQGPHSQTLWPNKLRRKPKVNLHHERFELPDGDFVDSEWTSRNEGPIVLVLHGLEGSTKSAYAAGILNEVHKRGWRGAFMYHRSCSGVPNRLHRRYHAGETRDLDTVISILTRREPETPILIVGYSLGGNILLKWLGETETLPKQIAGAVAVSVPFDLNISTDKLNKGFSQLYQFAMLKKMQRSIKRKYRHHNTSINLKDILNLKSLRELDRDFTAPVHGFSSLDEYYANASSRSYLKHIDFPTLILHADDDPFMTKDAVPTLEELSSNVTLELTKSGGHVGFVHGHPWRPKYYLEERIPNYFQKRLDLFYASVATKNDNTLGLTDAKLAKSY